MAPERDAGPRASGAEVEGALKTGVPLSTLLRQVRVVLGTGQRLWLAAFTALMVVGAAFEALGIGLVVPFIAMLSNPAAITTNPHLRVLYEYSGVATETRFLILAALALLAVFVVKNLYLGALTYLTHWFITTRQVRLAERLFSFYLHLPYVYHLRRNTAALINVLSTEIGRVYAGVVLPLLTVAAEGTVLLFILALLFLVEPQITLIALAVTGVAAAGIYLSFHEALNRFGEERVRHSGLMIKGISQGLGSIKETIVAGREEFFVRAFASSGRFHARASRFFAVANALPRLVIEAVAVGGLLLVVMIILLRGDGMAKAIPALALFAMAAMRITPSLNRLFGAVSSIRFYTPAVTAVCRDVLESERDRDMQRPVASPVAGAGSGARGLELKDITFSYDGAAASSISNVTISVPKGTSVGIVGPSGAGKTTLVDLILGLLRPGTGNILVDGRDIHLDLVAWQRTIGYVPQFIYLLDDTVRRNVALGVPDEEIDSERVRQALELAQLDGLIRTLPQDIGTEIGEHGVRLSGGERQRVGIARALYHRPDVLVFDEATSALDSATEAGIIATISRLSGSRTIIQVAHRLSTIRQCDVIYYLARGRVLDHGRYDELISRLPEFRLIAGEQEGVQGLDGAGRARR